MQTNTNTYFPTISAKPNAKYFLNIGKWHIIRKSHNTVIHTITRPCCNREKSFVPNADKTPTPYCRSVRTARKDRHYSQRKLHANADKTPIPYSKCKRTARKGRHYNKREPHDAYNTKGLETDRKPHRKSQHPQNTKKSKYSAWQQRNAKNSGTSVHKKFHQ